MNLLSVSATQTSDRVNILRNAIKTGANTSATKDFSYTYDGNGNIKTVQQVTNNGGSTLLYTYHYDAANQLTRVDDKVQDLTIVYAYNAGGNLVSRTNYKYTTGTPLLVKRTWLYTYDSAWKDQLAYYDAKRIQYDNVGNPTSYNGWVFSWEAGRQLASMSKSGTDIAYQYNADGLRTKKTVTQSGASTVYEYLWNESKLVGQKVGNDAVRILYDANDEPVGFTVNDSASYFYVKNLQDDVLAIVDKTGAEKVSYVYDAYGQIVSVSGDATLQKLNPCTYRGYYYDAETGLYYLQSRYYNPEWGRFINADSPDVMSVIQENVLSSNAYAYCNNNPINNSDPTGYVTPANLIGAVIGAIIGAVGGYFLTRWMANRLGLKGWRRNAFVWGLTAVISATASVIGYFVGPYISRLGRSAINSIKKALINSACFTKGTLISTEQGHIPIENIQVGDYVYSENPETGEQGLKRVLQVFEKDTDVLIRLEINDEVVITTEEHPFWIIGKGWTEANNIELGDYVQRRNKEPEQITNKSIIKLESPVIVYNLEVEDWHTYYVSNASILVHNKCSLKFARKSASQIERMVGVKSGTFHRIMKPKILKSAGNQILKKVGKNPDILIAQDGTIQLVSTIKRGVSVITKLNIFDFIP